MSKEEERKILEEKKIQGRAEDAEAIRRIQNGDKSAYTMLQNKYKLLINSLMRKMVHDEDDIDDLTQETFIKAYNAIDTFNFNYAFSSWLYKIASNTCIDFLRKKRFYTISLSRPFDEDTSDTVFEVEDTSSLPDMKMINDEKTAIIEAAIEALPEKYKHIIHLRHTEELDYAEIAARLGIPLGTVKVNLFRARKMLQLALRKYTSIF